MANVSCDETFTVACLTFTQAIFTVASMLTVIVLGNFLVVFTVYRDRKLRSQRQNWLIVSLAVADLLVGLLVMPLTLIYEVLGEWKLGLYLCELWLALDVLFVTASILHICAISLDRYWSVTSPLAYPTKRTPRRMLIMIGSSWLISLMICLPPIFGWRPERREGECSVSTDLGYVLYSSLGSFYIPVIILVIVYAKIYSITIRHSRQRLKQTERQNRTLCQLTAQTGNAPTVPSVPLTPSSGTTPVSIHARQIVELELIEENSEGEKKADGEKETIGQVCWHLRKISEDLTRIGTGDDVRQMIITRNNNHTATITEIPTTPTKEKDVAKLNGSVVGNEKDKEKEKPHEQRKRKLKAKERQATLLLGIILSAFILSWLPFFVLYVTAAIGLPPPPAVVFKFFFWLGYCNSGINPVIYTVFNREFKRGLCRQLKRFEHYIGSLDGLLK